MCACMDTRERLTDTDATRLAVPIISRVQRRNSELIIQELIKKCVRDYLGGGGRMARRGSGREGAGAVGF